MTAGKRRSRRGPEPQLVIADSKADRWWKWGGRIGGISVVVLGAAWVVFSWYNGVEGMKPKLVELATDLKIMGAKVEDALIGQKAIQEDNKKISETLRRIEPVVEKIAKQR